MGFIITGDLTNVRRIVKSIWSTLHNSILEKSLNFETF